MTTSSELLECAIEVARRAGMHAMENSSRRKETIQVTEYDVKLKLDVECQNLAAEIIKTSFPAHDFLGEEDTGDNTNANSEYTWIVDPIDGTVNFSHGFPFWCNSIAVRDNTGKTRAAAVFAPRMNELFTATDKQAARVNNHEIHVSETQTLDKAMVLTGLDRNIAVSLPPMYFTSKLGSNCRKIRIAGAAALDLCRVATGESDGYFEAGIFIWDIAAGALIVKQAGGMSEQLAILPGKRNRLAFIATNGLIHENLKSVIAEGIDSIQDSTDQR